MFKYSGHSLLLWILHGLFDEIFISNNWKNCEVFCVSNHTGMKSTKVQTLGANRICVRDWGCAGEKLANTTSYGNRSIAVYSYIPW